MATKKKTRVLFRLPWGQITADMFGDPVFKGDPDKYAAGLMRRHQTAGALGIADTLINNAPGCGVFWTRVKEVIDKRVKTEAAAKLGKV